MFGQKKHLIIWGGGEEASESHSNLAVGLVLHKIPALRQFGTVLDKYLIEPKKWQLSDTHRAV